MNTFSALEQKHTNLNAIARSHPGLRKLLKTNWFSWCFRDTYGKTQHPRAHIMAPHRARQPRLTNRVKLIMSIYLRSSIRRVLHTRQTACSVRCRDRCVEIRLHRADIAGDWGVCCAIIRATRTGWVRHASRLQTKRKTLFCG